MYAASRSLVDKNLVSLLSATATCIELILLLSNINVAYVHLVILIFDLLRARAAKYVHKVFEFCMAYSSSVMHHASDLFEAP